MMAMPLSGKSARRTTNWDCDELRDGHLRAKAVEARAVESIVGRVSVVVAVMGLR